MGDLGALQFVPEFDIERWTDDQVMEVIRYSNVVYNVIGNWKSTNQFPREMVNVEWPERLARLVAEKDDGTRLVHLVHLNCEDEQVNHSSLATMVDFCKENTVEPHYIGQFGKMENSFDKIF